MRNMIETLFALYHLLTYQRRRVGSGNAALSPVRLLYVQLKKLINLSVFLKTGHYDCVFNKTQ